MALPIRRRALLVGAGLGAAALLVPGALASPAMAGTASLLTRWRALLIGEAADLADPAVKAAVARIERVAAGHLATMTVTGSALWPDLATPGRSGHVTSSFSRIAQIALAWATPGTTQHLQPATAQALVDALDWMSANRYSPQLPRYDNDWDWEIGAPTQLNNAIVLLHDVLGAERIARLTGAVKHYTPDPNLWRADRQIATGANRVWVATVVAVRAVIDGDEAALAEVRDALSDVRGGGANSVLAFSDGTDGTGEGFYADGSFLQHWKHPYNGGYGKELLNTLSKLLHLLAGSAWAVTDPEVGNVFRWVDEAFDPLMFRGDMMAAVCGREIARPSKQGHAPTQSVIEATLRLIDAGTPEQATHLTRLVKRWIAEDTYRDFLAVTDLASITVARRVLAAVPTAYPPPVLHRQYPRMDKAVHHRPGFGYAVSAYSSRIYNYESIQNENLRGWHLSDGMVLLYNDDLGHYSEDYWPTVDPYRLPGTTVDTARLADGFGQRQTSQADWAGGAALPGTTLAAYGMDLRSYGTTLRALKSWFFVDDAVVCVGSGISGGSQVETVVENRKLRDPAATLLADGSAVQGGVLEGARWCHLAGAGGYVFAAPTDVRALREQRTGRWLDINAKYGTPAEITRPYLTLWLEHGPGSTGYAYTQLPAASAAQTAAWSANPRVRVLAATEQVHAAGAPGFLAANFWAAGRVGELAADGPLSVVAHRTRFALSDPTQLRDRVVLEVFRPGARLVKADTGVRLERLRDRVRLIADTRGGATLTAVLSR